MDRGDQENDFNGVLSANGVPVNNSGERLLVKLKNSPTPPLLPAGEALAHRCYLCDKAFSSGKALGGHMRVHYQGKEILVSKKTAADHGGNGFSGEPFCPTCGKEFPSLKALYGHMRSHPERPWRGIRPPGAGDREIITPSELPRWSVTARRGRKIIAGDDADDREDVVQNLMLLRKRPPGSAKDEPENSGEETERTAPKVRKIDEISGDRKSTVSPAKFRCSICSKSFRSHQALGGHKSSHNKAPKKTVPMVPPTSSSGFESSSLDNTPAPAPAMSSSEDERGRRSRSTHQLVEVNFNMIINYRCSDGGKGVHSAGTLEAPASHVEAAGEPHGRRVLDFDLNEEPPMKER